MKKIVLLPFKRTSDDTEASFQDMVPLVVGQRSVREEEWLETLRIFEIGKVDGKRIIDRLGDTLLNEHETHFGSYW
jgi:hypothetical protein